MRGLIQALVSYIEDLSENSKLPDVVMIDFSQKKKLPNHPTLQIYITTIFRYLYIPCEVCIPDW